MPLAHPPTSSAGEPATDGDDSAALGGDPAAEVKQLAAAVRSRLRFLEDGGALGLPKPRRRAAAKPPAAAAPRPSAGPAEHLMVPSLPAASPPRLVALPSSLPPPPPRPSRLVEAVYPELPDLQTLHGAAGLSILRQTLGDCRRCKLCFGRNSVVFDDGAAEPWIAFVGEGPGADEDRLGKPFVGAAGQLLDRMIEAMAGEARKRGLTEAALHLSRAAVYICNIVKCRPPGNRAPEADEIAACTPFLRGQLYSLRPSLRAIVALGRTPTQYLLNTTTPIGSLRGRFADWEGIPVMPTYHPAYLLRTPSAKRQVWEDLQIVLEKLGAADPGQPPPQSSP